MKNNKTIILIVVVALIAIVTISIVFIAKGNSKEKLQNEVMNNIAQENKNSETQNTPIGEEGHTEEENNEIEKLPDITLKGKIAAEKSKYTDSNGNIAVIPAGFEVVTNSPNINDGLVISDVENDDLENSKKGNQFVWIPVPDPVIDVSRANDDSQINEVISKSIDDGKYPMAIKLESGDYKSILYEFKSKNLGSAIDVSFVRYQTGSNGLCEPENLRSGDNKDNITDWTDSLYQEEYNEMIKAVKESKGFWVARFETSISSEGIAQSKKDEGIFSGESWYSCYNVQKTLNVETTKSHMIWGAQWDQIMIWLKNVINNDGVANKFYILDSTNMGNYLETQVSNKEENIIIKDKGVATKCKSGEIEISKVKNIYDLAGNVFEWTMEANYLSVRIVRGGYCTYGATTYPASSRYYTASPDYINTAFGSRMVLY